MRRRRLWQAGACLLAVPAGVLAHGARAGTLRIDHPYALPTEAGVDVGAVYLRGLRNEGSLPDRLLAASTPAASRVQILRRQAVDGTAQAHVVPDLPLPAGASVPMRHDGTEGYHLVLRDLHAPLRAGARFPLRLRFERAGEHEVTVWVQAPRTASQGAGRHDGH
jgi:copper(I)-binding protein